MSRQPVAKDQNNPTLEELRALRRWAADQNWHDLALEGLGEIPEDLLLLQERWLRCEITDAEFRQGVVELVSKTARGWTSKPSSVLSKKDQK